MELVDQYLTLNQFHLGNAKMLAVYLCIAVMALLGAAFGFVLAAASKRFAVQMHPRAEQVYDVLPQIDCGACGHAGCRDYAEKVAEGLLPVDLCVPAGPETAAAVAGIMGVDYISQHLPTRAVVHCQGGIAETVQEFVYNGVADCPSAMLVQGGPKTCKYACLGLGTCADVCPYSAITMNENGLPVIDEEKCVSCGLCVKACPRDLITILDSRHRTVLGCSSHGRGKGVKDICSIGCIACGICVKESKESGAVTLVDSLPVIDYEKWQEAEELASLEKCPTHTYCRQPTKEEVLADASTKTDTSQ